MDRLGKHIVELCGFLNAELLQLRLPRRFRLQNAREQNGTAFFFFLFSHHICKFLPFLPFLSLLSGGLFHSFKWEQQRRK